VNTPLRVAVLASGCGSNARRLFDLASAGALAIDPVLLICNRPGARALERAVQAGVPFLLLDHAGEPDRERYDRSLVAALKEARAELIVMAGYMRLVTPFFLRSFPGQVINIHPALLPSFSGMRGAAEALEYGVRLSGCTVHFVDEVMDRGPVIIQAAVPVTPDDDRDALQARIHALEHRIYPQAVQWLAEKRVRLEGRQVRILPAAARRAVAPDGSWLAWPPLEEPF
jgi:phosphoribosylglycinamide formyltransferase-1